ncbi:PaaI family thioesterase [Promicromonospora thailandica]|uniref:Domain 1-containing protein n=1 Tax=Promicromonospora thailandica TaxID=765201 RepID=A0A9X2G3X5_9MICO|nr:PaaI family thioesterase [Promicromonospora thailandica]MCP2264882.1 putative domain 1-containing protein [Promicromonospora thailandica]BFF18853.1 PaaI family thioesterase [Promicromonospora thailandica]
MSDTQQTSAPATPGPDDAPESWGEPRTRELTWYDPLQIAAQAPTMAGVEFLRRLRDGVIPPPPITTHFGLDIDEVEEGRVTFTCTPDESGFNPIGTIHGGVLCTLLDTVCGCAIQSVLPAGKGYTSVEIKVNYLKAVRGAGAALTAEGTVVKAGSRVGFTEAVVRDATGAVVATATSTLLIFDIPQP